MRKFIANISNNLNKVDLATLNSTEKYAISYLDNSLSLLILFEKSRLEALELWKSNLNDSKENGKIKPETYYAIERLNKECKIFIDSIYTNLHRVELLTRPSRRDRNQTKLDVKFQMDEDKKNSYLNEFRYITEIRNKIIEHASGNLFFYSKFGEIFNLSDPNDFRILILSTDWEKRVSNGGDLENLFNQIVEKFKPFAKNEPDTNVERLIMLNGCAHLMSYSTDIKPLFEKIYVEIGCVFHQPIELASIIHNMVSLFFFEKIPN